MLAVLDCRAPRALTDWIASQGNSVLCIPPHPALPAPVSAHPDMLLFFAADAIYVTESYARIAARELEQIAQVSQKNIRTVAEEYRTEYPFDVLLNAAPVGKYLFCLPNATAKRITARKDYRICPVRQGYAKCSVIPVGDHALMTADASIERAARQNGLEVLRLQSGGIALPGYDYGFPGGCASFAPYGGTRELYFGASPEYYPDVERMRTFCEAHGYRLLTPKSLAPTDVGTIFLI
ncbi:MAG: hypothetical protein IJW49_09325 [Clostridia bacterium]|nr:hypothetical protein [Clostridia bacterium]